MKRLLQLTLMLFAFTATAWAQVNVYPITSHPRYKDLEIDVWMDQPDGSVYYPGEEITVLFRANLDCYVTLYNIDSQGYIHRLWPHDRFEDNYVRGYRTYQVPDRYDGYELRIDGPEGIEYVQAVASLSPYDVPDFEYRQPSNYRRNSGYHDNRDDWDVSFGIVQGDPFLAINKINRHCIPDSHWERKQTAVDMAYFYVERYVYYPRTVCSDCHAERSNQWNRYDPYNDVCTEVVFYFENEDNCRYNGTGNRRYEPRYRYKKRDHDDRGRWKNSPDDRYRPGSGYGDMRYKSGAANIVTEPKEQPPAKFIETRHDRDRYKDPKPEKKYGVKDEVIRPQDAIGVERFKTKTLPSLPTWDRDQDRTEDPRPLPPVKDTNKSSYPKPLPTWDHGQDRTEDPRPLPPVKDTDKSSYPKPLPPVKNTDKYEHQTPLPPTKEWRDVPGEQKSGPIEPQKSVEPDKQDSKAKETTKPKSYSIKLKPKEAAEPVKSESDNDKSSEVKKSEKESDKDSKDKEPAKESKSPEKKKYTEKGDTK